MSVNTSKLHIVYLVYTDLTNISGGLRIISYHVNGLLQLGHKVEIWVPRGMTTTSYFHTKASIKTFIPSDLSTPDVLVMTDPVCLDIVPSFRKAGLTYLLLQHDVDYVYELSGFKDEQALFTEYSHYLNTSCKIIVVSDWVKNMVKVKYGLPANIIRNGIDNTIFHPDPSPLIQTGDPVLLTFYDSQDWKGFADTSLAISQVLEKIPELKILIIGKAFPVNSGKGVNSGLGFPAIYFSKPSQRDMSKLYSSATVFVSASWQEGFGLPGLEAMACGIPIVTTDSGGVKEYAIHNETAIITPPKNASLLAEGILKVLGNKRLRTKFTNNGLKKAKEFKWSKSIKQLEAVFIHDMLAN